MAEKKCLASVRTDRSITRSFKHCIRGIAHTVLLSTCCIALLLSTGNPTSAAVTYRRVLVSGDPAPGLPGATYGPARFSVGLPTIDDEGQVSFVTEMSTAVDAQAVWTETNGIQNYHALSGDPAPGTDAGIIFDNFGRITRHTDGSLTFVSNLAGPGTNNSNNRDL